MDEAIETAKVPETTLIFWIIKILATTLGETGGDAVSMSMSLGYAISSAIFIGVFVVAVVAQLLARKFHPVLYWCVVVATTTAGTTMADLGRPLARHRLSRRCVAAVRAAVAVPSDLVPL